MEAAVELVDRNEALSDFKYISKVAAAIVSQDYKGALQKLKAGLENSIESEKQYNSQDLLKWFHKLVMTLEITLEEAYGDEWAESIEVPEIQDKEIHCSFCGKEEKEVAKIIAGAHVYVCDECVEICHEIVVEDRATRRDGV